jgi:hypothetical protein
MSMLHVAPHIKSGLIVCSYFCCILISLVLNSSVTKIKKLIFSYHSRCVKWTR